MMLITLAVSFAPAALAQPVAKAKDSGGWIAVLICLTLVLFIGVGSFLSSRRSHQD